MFEQMIIVGNLGHDPELRYTSAGVPVCSFSVAVTKKWKDQNGEQHEKTKWFKVSAWRKLAETCHQYLAKGRPVMVIGTVDASSYTNKEGKPTASLELTADVVKFLGSKSDNGYGHDDGEGMPAVALVELDEEEIPF